jgi:hypothetical protein
MDGQEIETQVEREIFRAIQTGSETHNTNISVQWILCLPGDKAAEA